VLVRPMIGGWEPRGIEAIVSEETRRLVPLAVPGLAGDLHQDLGRGAQALCIVGSLSGDEARDDFLKDLRTRFKEGAPVDFVADIVGESDLERVLIREFRLEERADSPDSFRYEMVLVEYTEPPEPPSPGLDLGLDDLGLDIDLGLDLLDLAGMLGSVPPLGDMLAPVQEGAAGLKQALGGAGTLLAPVQRLFG
jgi:hypothetical protein